MLCLQATKETISYLKSLICNPFFHYMDRNELLRLKLELLASMQYILKQLLTSVLVKVVDTYQAILQLGKYPPLLSFQLQTLSSSYQLFFLVTLCRRAWPHLLWSWKKAPNIAWLVIDHLISICTFMEWLLTIPLHFSEYTSHVTSRVQLSNRIGTSLPHNSLLMIIFFIYCLSFFIYL